MGGVEAINLSHFIGAVHGMERLMGRGQNPLRDILNYASESYLQSQYDLVYILTVMGTDEKTGDAEMKGLYIGRDQQCYDLACGLSLKVNFNLLDREPKKMVVYLNEEYSSMWRKCPRLCVSLLHTAALTSPAQTFQWETNRSIGRGWHWRTAAS